MFTGSREEGAVDTKNRGSVKTKVGTITRADVRNAIHSGKLSEEEERYVRLRFGISENLESPIVRPCAAFPEARAKIALIEADILDHQGLQPTNPLKERIIEHLKKL